MTKEIHFGKLYKKTDPNSIYCQYIVPISVKVGRLINIIAVDTGNEGFAHIQIIKENFALDETE